MLANGQQWALHNAKLGLLGKVGLAGAKLGLLGLLGQSSACWAYWGKAGLAGAKLGVLGKFLLLGKGNAPPNGKP